MTVLTSLTQIVRSYEKFMRIVHIAWIMIITQFVFFSTIAQLLRLALKILYYIIVSSLANSSRVLLYVGKYSGLAIV